MKKKGALVLAAVLVTSQGLPFPASYAGESDAASGVARIASDGNFMLAQYGTGSGPGRDFGPGTGTGTGNGAGPGQIECRVERIPGSGLGPQRVCYRCSTFVVPGSGRGPQRRCEPM